MIDERTIRTHTIRHKGRSASDLRNKVIKSLEQLGHQLTLDDITTISENVQAIWDRRNR